MFHPFEKIMKKQKRKPLKDLWSLRGLRLVSVHALHECIKFRSQTLQSLSDRGVISVTQGGGNLCLGFAIGAHVQDMTVNVMKLIGRKE